MKYFLALTEYNLHAIRKPLLWILALMGPVEFLLLALISWMHPDFIMYQPFYIALQYPLVICPLCMIAAAFINYSTTLRQNGKAKSIYTMMTLPCRRSLVFWSQVVSGIIAIAAVMAAQALWYILLYTPSCWMVNLFSDRYLHSLTMPGEILPAYTAFIKNGLFLSMIRSGFMRLIFPTGLLGFVSILAAMICPVICLQSISCRRSGWRIAHILAFIVCGLLVLALMAFNFKMQFLPNDRLIAQVQLLLIGGQLALAAFAAASGLYGLCKSKNL